MSLWDGLQRCNCGVSLSVPSDRRRVRCTSCDLVFDIFWRTLGPSKIATPGGWKREPRKGPVVEKSVGWKFSMEDLERIRWGFTPREMEEKWFIVVENEQLFFHRSWTGHLVFVASLAPDGIPVLEMPEELKPPHDDPDFVLSLIERLLIGEGKFVRPR